MDALRAAAPLARRLLTLAEAGREGEVTIVRRARRARLRLVAGRAVALSGVDVAPLGDTLLALGSLDVGALRAMCTLRAPGPVGARMVAAGLLSSAAVAHALDLQLVRGIDALLALSPCVAQFTESTRDLARTTSGSVDVTSAVWSVLLRRAHALPDATLASLSGAGPLVLGATGRRRVQALLCAIERGELAKVARLAACDGGAARPVHAPTSHVLARAIEGADDTREQRAIRAVLRVLGGVTVVRKPDEAFALLLRKRRELARNVSASALLDLPESAGAEHARRALRRLAHKLHPDRFQCDARLHAVSTEVMSALSRAAHALREGVRATR